MGLPRERRLKQRQEFKSVYERGKRFYGSHFTLIVLEAGGSTRFGISVSLKVSKKAVIRNRFKRVIRAAIRELSSRIGEGWLAVVVVRPGTVECKYEHFLRELEQLLMKADIIHGN